MYYGKIATINLAPGTYTFVGNERFSYASIANDKTSAANITVKGNVSIFGLASQALDIIPEGEITLLESNGIDGVIIVVPAGCTATVVASKSIHLDSMPTLMP